jgi:hypothetical protein
VGYGSRGRRELHCGFVVLLVILAVQPSSLHMRGHGTGCGRRGATARGTAHPPRSFYFAVDVISTLSILLDIPPVMDPIIQSANDGNGDAQQRTGLENAAQITAAATRAARLAQASRRHRHCCATLLLPCFPSIERGVGIAWGAKLVGLWLLPCASCYLLPALHVNTESLPATCSPPPTPCRSPSGCACGASCACGPFTLSTSEWQRPQLYDCCTAARLPRRGCPGRDDDGGMWRSAACTAQPHALASCTA